LFELLQLGNLQSLVFDPADLSEEVAPEGELREAV